jgi:RNA polymerase sigma-70 factor (ECF subfamily)
MDDDEFRHVVTAAQAGQRAAVASLYREYNPMLVRFLQAQIPATGEDLAHETWLEAAVGMAHFKGDERAFRRWLLSLARAQVIQHAGSPEPPTAPVDPLRLAAMAERQPPEDVRVADAAVAQLLAGLPPDHAEVLLLRIVGGLSAEETGVLIGKSPGAVRVIQHRALRRVAKRLSEERVAP